MAIRDHELDVSILWHIRCVLFLFLINESFSTRLRLANDSLSGSVGTPATPYTDDQPSPIPVRWEEQWFTAPSVPYTAQHGALECASSYRTQHDSPPSHILFYADGDTYAVRFEVTEDSTYTVDEDDDRLIRIRPTFSSADGSGDFVRNKRTGEIVKRKEPASVACSPFSADLRAAIHAFDYVLQSLGSHHQYRWIVDCQGICKALSTIEREKGTQIYPLRERIAKLTNVYEDKLDIVWVSSHCGLRGNNEADKLARAALSRPPQGQLAVAADFSDARAVIRSRKKNTAQDLDKLLNGTPKECTIRKAHVTLNQLFTGFCAPFQPFRRLGGEKCRHCHSEETVAHFFTCAARVRRIRAHFRDRIDWRRRILQKPSRSTRVLYWGRRA